MIPDLISETRAKHRARALQAIAEHCCATDMTDGFCVPRDGKCQQEGRHRDCCRRSAGILAAIESRGMSVIWGYDKRITVMPLYMCSRCGSVENTALGEYWRQHSTIPREERSGGYDGISDTDPMDGRDLESNCRLLDSQSRVQSLLCTEACRNAVEQASSLCGNDHDREGQAGLQRQAHSCRPE